MRGSHTDAIEVNARALAGIPLAFSPKRLATLRDMFAMHAVEGAARESMSDGVESTAKQLARRAYAIADAMMAAREVKP